jgi:hypothetical protein
MVIELQQSQKVDIPTKFDDPMSVVDSIINSEATVVESKPKEKSFCGVCAIEVDPRKQKCCKKCGNDFTYGVRCLDERQCIQLIECLSIIIIDEERENADPTRWALGL